MLDDFIKLSLACLVSLSVALIKRKIKLSKPEIENLKAQTRLVNAQAEKLELENAREKLKNS